MDIEVMAIISMMEMSLFRRLMPFFWENLLIMSRIYDDCSANDKVRANF